MSWLLKLSNQGDALVIGGHIALPKLLLTDCVPFCVSTFEAVSLRLKLMRRNVALAGAGGSHDAN